MKYLALIACVLLILVAMGVIKFKFWRGTDGPPSPTRGAVAIAASSR